MTAILETEDIGHNNFFDDGVYIGKNVRIGNNNRFLRGTVIHDNVEIADNNLFSNYVVVGSQGEMGLKGDVIPEGGKVIIGSNNTIREFVVIGFPALTLETRVGNGNYFMARSHVPHDCYVGSTVVMAPNSALGGMTHVEDFVFIGLGAMTHHGRKLGEGSMIAMQAANARSVPPFVTVAGVPSKIRKLNRIGAERRGFSKDVLDEVENNLRDIVKLRYQNSSNVIIQKIQTFMAENELVVEMS